MKRTYWAAIALIACSGCATAPGTRGAAYPAGTARSFTVRTTPAGASIETTLHYRCTSPCEVPLGGTAFVATVTLLGYKPVQIPVAAGQTPRPLDITLVPQDPGAGAPNPVGGGAPAH